MRCNSGVVPSPSVIGSSGCSGNAARYRHRLRREKSIWPRTMPAAPSAATARGLGRTSGVIERECVACAWVEVSGGHAGRLRLLTPMWEGCSSSITRNRACTRTPGRLNLSLISKRVLLPSPCLPLKPYPPPKSVPSPGAPCARSTRPPNSGSRGNVCPAGRERRLTRWGAVCFAIDRAMPRDVPLAVRRQLYADILARRSAEPARYERGILSYVVDVRAVADQVEADLATVPARHGLDRRGRSHPRGCRNLPRHAHPGAADRSPVGAGCNDAELREDYPRLTQEMMRPRRSTRRPIRAVAGHASRPGRNTAGDLAPRRRTGHKA